MIFRRGREGRATPASLRAAGTVLAALALVLGVASAAGAGEGAISDPRDSGARLDLKALTHADDGSFVVYTAETFTPFTDQAAAFNWGIDRDSDEDFDLIVFTEWRGGKLVGGVKETAGREVADASVSRPAPNSIKVSFPVGALGGASAYRYAVNAGSPGQSDLAPDAGLSPHRLRGASAEQPRVASSTPPAEPTPIAAAPAPAPKPSPAGPPVNLPATGSNDSRSLLPAAGAAFMVGGALIAVPRRSRRSRRGV